MLMKLPGAVLAIAALLIMSSCGEQPAEAPEVTATPATTEPVALPRTASAPGASVFFIAPADGATVSSPVSIEFGIEGMTVAPAGVNDAHSGHHHLLVDTGLPDLGLPIPADTFHIHFGDGSTTTTLNLQAGEHTLQMLLGDHLHIPHSPPVASEVITITVE
ncbi:MAG: DUF4399 domain-containing protein [Woeseiaceae bacterium]